MVTNRELKEYLRTEVGLANLTPAELDTRLDRAIEMGIGAFWMSWAWKIKTRAGALSVTASKDTYDLPSDFSSMKSFVEQETSDGSSLTYKQKEEFDEVFPKLSSINDGSPEFYTIYMDNKDQKYKIAFAPRPDSSDSYPFVYNTIPPSDIVNIPNDYLELLTLFVVKFLYAAGSQARLALGLEIGDALKRTIPRDRLVDAAIHRLHEKTSTIRRSREWVGWLPSF